MASDWKEQLSILNLKCSKKTFLSSILDFLSQIAFCICPLLRITSQKETLTLKFPKKLALVQYFLCVSIQGLAEYD